MRKARRHPFGDIDSCEQVGNLVAESPEALEHGVVPHEICGQQPDGRLHEDPREARRLAHPLRERLPSLAGEPVMRPGPRSPGLLSGRQVPELLEALGLRVPLALRELPVDPTLAGHAHEVVRTRPLAPDEDEDDVGEGSESVS